MPVNPSNFKDLTLPAVLLYYGPDGMWEQAEIGKMYMAWDPQTKTNVFTKLEKVVE